VVASGAAVAWARSDRRPRWLSLVALGMLGGATVGLAILGWSWVAGLVPLENIPPLAVAAVLLIVPVTVVLANALALWPGRMAASVRPADALRTE
jgi:hypothetical protein